MNKDFLKKLPFLIFLLFIIGPILGSKIIPVLLMILFIFFIYQKFNKIIPGLRDKTNMADAIDINNLKDMAKIKRIFLIVVLAILILWLFFASIVVVDAGETGVYSLFGKVKDDELRSGFHLVIPLAKVNKMSIRTEEYTMSVVSGEGKKTGNDAISALTKEGLSVDLDITVLYHLEEVKASDIYKNIGLDYEEKIIRPDIRSTIREVIAQYDAKDIYSEKRQEAAVKIAESLRQSAGPRGIVIEDVLLRNVQLPDNLSKSIQEKLQAEQEAQKYEFLLDREKKEKERKIIEAEGQRDAQKIINESLSSNYLYYLYINQLKDRQGTIYVPTNPSTGMPMFKDLGQ